MTIIIIVILSITIWPCCLYESPEKDYVDDINSTESDEDGDGWMIGWGDCDDRNPNIYPGAPENIDGIDNDDDSPH